MRPLAFALALAWIGTSGCSADDGNTIADAGEDDGAAPLTFETVATDLATNTALFDVAVTDVGSAEMTTSAPNGRAVLSITGSQATTVRHTLDGYLTNTMAVDFAALTTHNVGNQALVSDLVTTTELDTIFSGLALTRDPAATQLFLYVRASNFAPATEVTVTVTGAGQSFVRSAQREFTPGQSPVADALVLVPNVIGTSAAVSFSTSCPGPATVALAPGEIASAFYVCDPSL